jgi:2-amino-4-hydroxy-6-hydroxymethyldihydropteridine diphosphokinase
MTLAVVALGSNLGDRLGFLRIGLAGLRRLGNIKGISSLYETAPVGGPEQEPYLNAVVAVETAADAMSVLAALQGIEGEAGRVREERWGPRTLDLDLILYDDEAIATEQLTVPHPRAAERRFVLEPLAEVIPDARIGVTPVNDLLAGMADQKVVRVAGPWETELVFVGSGRPWILAQFGLGAIWGVVLLVTGKLDMGWPARVLGLTLAVGGIMLLLAAVRALGSAMTADPIPKAASLIESGPFQVVRHPTYSGVLLILVGFSVAFGSWPAGVVAFLLAAFFFAKAQFEERHLRILYPEYAAYSERVKARLIPYLV